MGVHSLLTPFEQKSTKLANRISVIFLFILLASIAVNLLLGSWFFIPALGGTALLLGASYYLTARQYYGASRFLLCLSLNGLVFFMSLMGAFGSGIEFYFIGLAVLPYILFRKSNLVYPLQAISIAALMVQKFAVITVPDSTQLPVKVFYIFNSFFSCLTVILVVKLFRDVNKEHEDELVQKNLTIEEKNRQLVETIQEVDSFAHTASHDLRSPLRTISSYAQIMQEDYSEKLDENANRLLNNMVAGARRMRILTDDLLAFSKAGTQLLTKNTVDMNAVVRRALQEAGQGYDIANVNLQTGPLPAAMGDTALLHQVWLNFLSNAFKFSAKVPHPAIIISAETKPDKIIYSIQDNGAGFDQANSAKLFGLFQRLHAQDDFEGTGLGLSIVKRIIERHGGTVWANSEPGKGATFYFSLPK